MKIALVTDLHANRQAVEALLDHARGDFTRQPCIVMECIKGVSLRSRLGSVSSEGVAKSDCTVTVVRE